METKTKKVSKYLTDLKELPVESTDEEKMSEKAQKQNVKKEMVVNEVQQVSNKMREEVVPKPKTQKTTTQPMNDDNSDEEDIYSIDETVEIEEKPYTSKDIILGVINFLSIVLLIFLLIKLPQKALESKTLRIENLKNSQSSAKNSISPENVKKAEDLQKLFLDDFGVVNFTVDIEKLKAENPAIKRVSFTSQKPIKDKLGLFGIPAVIGMEGSWDQIGKAMSSIESLTYLFRPVSIKSEASKEDPNVIILNYGGILYVGDKFTKN